MTSPCAQAPVYRRNILIPGAQPGQVVVIDPSGNPVAGPVPASIDDIFMGGDAAFNFSVSGGTSAQPDIIYFKNGATAGSIWYRGSITWVSDKITEIVWDKSLNGGATYSNLCTMTPGYTGDDLTSTSGGGAGLALVAWIRALMGSSGGSGLAFQGEWTATAYANDDVVTKDGSLYRANDTTAGSDIPGGYAFRAIEATAWLADATYHEDTLGFADPQVYSSTDDSVLPAVLRTSKVIGFNVTTGGTVTVDWDTPAGSPALNQYYLSIYRLGASLDSLSGFRPVLTTVSGSVLSPGSAALVGMVADYYFIVLTPTGAAFSPGAFKLKVTASAGAVIDVGPTIKWDLLSRSPVQRSLELVRGKATQETFASGEDFPGSDSYTVDWRNKSQATLRLTGALNELLFTEPGSNDADQPLRLTIINEDGNGSIVPGLFLNNPEIGFDGILFNDGLLPSALGPNPGDEIVVYFHWVSSTTEITASPFYAPVAAYANGAHAAARPPNDDFANATVIDIGTPVYDIIDRIVLPGVNNRFATRENVDEPKPTGADSVRSLWWKITTPASGGPYTLDVDTTQSRRGATSGLDTVLGLYTGVAVDAMTEIDADDDGGGSSTSSISTAVSNATDYYIYVAMFDASSGFGDVFVRFSLTGIGTPPSPPANDDFANAIDLGELTVPSGTITLTAVNNANATIEASEPDHAGSTTKAKSIWWKFSTPVGGGPYSIDLDTLLSDNFNTVLALYADTGGGLAGLIEQASNDDQTPITELRSQITGQLISDSATFYIAVASFDSSVDGDIVLRYSIS